MRKCLWMGAILLLAVAVSGCSMFADPKTADPKDFTLEELTITLTDAFSDLEVEGATGAFRSRDCSVFLIREGLDRFENGSEMTIADYAERVQENNQMEVEIKTEGDLTYFERSATTDGQTFNYYSVMYRAPEAFWLLQFACESDDYEVYRPYFVSWAQSVTFAGT